MNKNLQVFAIVLVVAVVAVFIGNKLLALLIFRNMEFKYSSTNKTANWIKFMTPLAQQVGKQFGLPWQALVVQTALETGWGSSSLFQKYNNYGGIKARPGQSSVTLQTVEYIGGVRTTVNAKFATFPSKYDGLVAYAKFFQDNKRYAEALKYPNDPYKFIEEIKKAGYATDPTYTAKLHGMLNKYFA